MDIHEKLRQLDTLYETKQLKNAEELINQWLKTALENNDLKTALTLYNEAEGLYRTTGRAALAASTGEKALQLIDRMNLRGTSFHATTVLNTATAYQVAGENQKALDMFQNAENIFELLSMQYSYQAASLYNNISHVYQNLNRHEEALVYLEKAMRIISSMPDSAGEIATTQVGMAVSLTALNRIDKAEKQLALALNYYQSKEGRNDGHYGSALCAAGDIQYSLKDYEQAAHYYKQALDATYERFGKSHGYDIIKEKLENITKKAE